MIRNLNTATVDLINANMANTAALHCQDIDSLRALQVIAKIGRELTGATAFWAAYEARTATRRELQDAENGMYAWEGDDEWMAAVQRLNRARAADVEAMTQILAELERAPLKA